MREIKFRAWNNNFKEFKFMSLINYLGGRGIMDDWADSENSVWEQYTGIKDKNGVEIYEGDVVKTNPMIPGDEEFTELVPIGAVNFFEGKYWIENSNGSIGVFQETVRMEVIGNIHENADLLEEQS